MRISLSASNRSIVLFSQFSS